MARKAAHPEKQLFDYLSGRLEAASAREVEEHLAACSECSRIFGLISALKSARPFEGPHTREARSEHPNPSDVAGFFYGKPASDRAETAAHVATCQSCAEEISEYARADAAAAAYKPAEHFQGKVPTAAWEMIREWEESSFAKPKPAAEMIGQELIEKLFGLLSKRQDWLRDARRSTTDSQEGKSSLDGIPVIVVDRSGQLRSVEIFERVTDASGADVLRHVEQSERFDDKTVHVLHETGGRQRVASYRVRSDSIRLEEASAEEMGDYFIIED